MNKLFVNYSGTIESFKRDNLETEYLNYIVFIQGSKAIYTHNTYYMEVSENDLGTLFVYSDPNLDFDVSGNNVDSYGYVGTLQNINVNGDLILIDSIAVYVCEGNPSPNLDVPVWCRLLKFIDGNWEIIYQSTESKSIRDIAPETLFSFKMKAANEQNKLIKYNDKIAIVYVDAEDAPVISSIQLGFKAILGIGGGVQNQFVNESTGVSNWAPAFVIGYLSMSDTPTNFVTIENSQTITGRKQFNDGINISGKSFITSAIDGGELKVLHNNSNKGFIVRTVNGSDDILPLEILSTNGLDSYKYTFPLKSGEVATMEDVSDALEGITSVEIVDNLDSDASDKALSANQGRILNEHINVVTTDVEEIDESIKSINETLGHTNAAINENTNNIKSNAEEIIKTKADLDALEGIVAEKADASKVSQIETDVQKNTNAISNNTARLVVLEGDGEGSIKNAVAKGIAQVVANAPDDLDTLKEVADYIASDKTKANEIEKTISDLGVKDTQLEDSINANATAILSKQPLLTGDEFKTINGERIMGEGNIDLPKVQVVNSLTEGGTDKALSAEMGKVLKGMIPTKVSELENDEGYITEIPDDYATKEDVSEAVSGKQDALTLTVKDNGNIVIGNISGQSKEFMPATPSGDPMHWAYVSAEAVYNATDNYILKDTPWKNMVDTIEDKAKWGLDVVDASMVKQMTINGVVYNYATENRTSPEGGTYLRYFLVGQGSNGVWVEDETKVLRLPGCWYMNGLGDITNAEMRRIWYEKEIKYRWDKARAAQNLKGRTTIIVDNVANIDMIGTLFSAYGISSEVIQISNLFKAAESSNAIHVDSVGSSNKSIYIQTCKSAKASPFANAHVISFYGLAVTCNLAKLNRISKPSILYTIQRATPTSAIAITLHADAYARLAEDADIVAALEAKNTALEGTGGSVSLVSV